jgi:hypothetical protein
MIVPEHVEFLIFEDNSFEEEGLVHLLKVLSQTTYLKGLHLKRNVIE